MKGLKVLQILGIIGYVGLVIGVGMDLANLFGDKEIFSTSVTLPFYIVALAGLVCDYIRIGKEKKMNKKK
ncbi:MAG: hypothetical protein J6D21_09525 [Clostridia bacterium]|nr:hypothetical protein [Clostridia bacterium]